VAADAAALAAFWTAGREARGRPSPRRCSACLRP
jgi:hypothetical protein